MKINISKPSVFLFVLVFLLIYSCKKKPAEEQVYISQPPVYIGQPISDTTSGGTVKGTMVSGHTYHISRDLIINRGDTVLVQAGVTVCLSNSANIVVKGVFISLGSATNPNWLTACGVVKTDVPGVSPSTDVAYSGKWGGINCDTSCTLLVLKWTHVEFTGAAFVNPPLAGQAAGTNSHTIFFQNINGTFVMEDSWLYGGIDEVRVSGGKIHIMRNTLEKLGQTGGDGFNVKSGTVGDMAYNLCVGVATNGTKASNKGGTPVQTNVTMYNNTYINCGYLRSSTGRGGCLNYEEGARGKAYNNLIVNCKFGFRVVNNPAADTLNLFYGNTLNYGDSISVTNQFYPTGYITKPHTTDIPLPSSFLPSNYTLGATYNGTSVVGLNNPQFINFTLPQTVAFRAISYASGFNFRLQLNSPAINKGYVGFSPLSLVPLDPKFGATEITLPGIDIGAYQVNGSGNQH